MKNSGNVKFKKKNEKLVPLFGQNSKKLYNFFYLLNYANNSTRTWELKKKHGQMADKDLSFLF